MKIAFFRNVTQEVWLIGTTNSEECVASIFRVNKSSRMRQRWSDAHMEDMRMLIEKPKEKRPHDRYTQTGEY
jgi:hypothetical protein